MVCKGWRSLIVAGDGSFLRRCLPEACPFPGFFSHCTYVGCPPRVSGNGRRFLSSFISRVPKGYFDYAVPLASRNSLLLVRLQPHSSGVKQDHRTGGVLLAVCHLSGAVHELPLLEHHRDFQQGSKVSGYTLLTAADCSSSNDKSRFFKVLVVTVQHRRMYHVLHTFSSSADDDSGWNTRSGVHGVPAMLRQHDAVVFGGAAHWLLGGTTGTYTLDVSAETGHVTSTEMVGVPAYGFHNKYYGKPCLTVDGEGNLTVLRLRRDCPRLHISTSFDNGRSFQTSMLVLRQPADQQTVGTRDVYRCLGHKCGMMVVQVNDGCIYIVDVKTGVTY